MLPKDPRPAVGVGEVGRLAARSDSGAVEFEGCRLVAPGRASPDEKRGSEDPVTKEAAVAAVATLSRVPRTSILVDERGAGRGGACGSAEVRAEGLSPIGEDAA